MRTRPRNRLLLAALPLLICSLLPAARAQFGVPFPGIVTLPNQDFTWVWGSTREDFVRGRPDIETRGYESQFECTLKAELRPSSHLGRPEIRDIEQTLSNSLYFIEASAQMMNQLDVSIDLWWAELACKKTGDAEPDAEKTQERLDKAVERAEREREKRRERATRE